MTAQPLLADPTSVGAARALHSLNDVTEWMKSQAAPLLAAGVPSTRVMLDDEVNLDHLVALDRLTSRALTNDRPADRIAAGARHLAGSDMAAWLGRVCDHLAAELATLPKPLRRFALIGMARRLAHHLAAVAVRAHPPETPPRVTAPPWAFCRPMATDARPPPTPERCRPAVMLTGPPAPRRHPRARTT